jgi:hypothetical protein
MAPVVATTTALATSANTGSSTTAALGTGGELADSAPPAAGDVIGNTSFVRPPFRPPVRSPFRPPPRPPF